MISGSNQPYTPLDSTAGRIFRKGGVFVPSPLALDHNMHHSEAYQRLLTLYYIESGARAVIPGAHTGEFALNDLNLLDLWMLWIKEMTQDYGDQMVLMAMIGGSEVMKQAELAAKHNFHAVMIAPTAFKGLPPEGVVNLYKEIASIIPTFAFELQTVIPGSYTYTPELWDQIFTISYGAKGASFDTYRSLVMLQAAAASERREELTLFTGNDDRIVADLLGQYAFTFNESRKEVNYHGGLLGHFATDTQAAVNWFQAIQKYRDSTTWQFDLSKTELAHAVNRCNMVLFDAINDFKNSVWGVKYRLSSLGLLPGPYCLHETGSEAQARQIDRVYGEYPSLCDDQYLEEQLPALKKEVGIKN